MRDSKTLLLLRQNTFQKNHQDLLMNRLGAVQKNKNHYNVAHQAHLFFTQKFFPTQQEREFTLSIHCMKTPRLPSFRPILVCIPLISFPLSAETISVTSNADSGEGSLRAALATAADGDLIEVAVTGNINLQSSLVVTRAVAIRGPGSTAFKVRRGEGLVAKFGVFEVRSGGVSISRLTIADGSRAEGGGIFRETGGDLLIEDCLLTGNRQEGNGFGGGAIALRGEGHTVIRGCVILQNTVVDGSTLTVHSGGGGILLGSGSLLVENSSLVENTGRWYGGGFYNKGGQAEFRNCTLSGNIASRAGGAFGSSGGSLTILSSTITRNQHGGAYIYAGKVLIGNSIVSGNLSMSDFAGGSLTSLGYNLVGNVSSTQFRAPGDVVGVTDPGLAPLGYYGGSTLIHPPTFDSIHVVDKGKSTLGNVTLSTDQHGRPRGQRAYWQEPAPGGDFSDIGAVELWEMSQSGGTLVVNTPDDSDDGIPGKLHCSLREAINHVNGVVKGERIIRFDPRVFGPGKPAREIALSTKLPTLFETSVEGPGAKFLTVRRAAVPKFSVFQADGLAPSSFSGLTIAGGHASLGGGIYASPPVTLVNCHIRDCIADGAGGGLFAKSGGLLMKGCTLSNNRAGNGGAGLSTSGEPSQIENSTFDGNRATSGFGGGINASGELTLTACTLTRGYAARAGGGIAASGHEETVITLRSCIVSGNESSDVCGTGYRDYAGFVSGGFNVIGTLFYRPDFTDGLNGDQVGVTDPKLGLLKDNGGPTPTTALLRGSPAIDRGYSFGLATDQRGLARTFDHPLIHSPPGGDGTDVGAFEVQRLSLDDWRRQYFTDEQLASAIAQPEGDANASGIPNSLKHLFGIDPLLPMGDADRAALPTLSNQESGGRDYLVISYRRSGLYSGPEEVVEYSTDLAEWIPAPRFITTTGPAGPDSFDQEVEVWVDMTGKPKAYLRVSVP
jgi:CSLREA domain-containing protein